MNETIDLNAVATFVRVVDKDGFTAAAEALGVPKSTVSRAVKRLESDLGVRLLQRTTRRVSLTEAGRAYYERVSSALAGMSEARAAIGDLQDRPRGTVRVTAPPDVGANMLAPIISKFVRKYPEIRVELSVTNRLVDLVQEGFDLAVRMGKLADSSLVARSLGTAELGLFASTQYLARAGTPRRLSDLRDHACVLFRGVNGSVRWQLDGPKGQELVEVRGHFMTDDMSCARAAIASGAGIGLVPVFANERLARVLPEYGIRGAPAHIVYPSARYVPLRVALLRDAILEAGPKACGQTVARGKKNM